MPTPRHHRFHIPVMGTGFTIDTPLKVARYGISSVVSLVDDVLIERMRRHHSAEAGAAYEPIEDGDDDSRARRIAAYLNLVDAQVRAQIERVREARFEPGSEITRYFELLPESPLKGTYRRMLEATGAKRDALEATLRRAVTPGRIDVNIMTKLDRDKFVKGIRQAPEFSDALSALRGFATSKARGAVILSAGMNRRLYAYLSKFDDFFPDSDGVMQKEIILKVSDLRSAVIQGKFLAKMGIWVSEFRIESGLNCGGHAFATQGHLMGPILDEFQRKRESVAAQLYEVYAAALTKSGRTPAGRPEQRVTAQGGIGTHAEAQLITEHYGLDGTGWGTPFLLVPEAVNVDAEHLAKLCDAKGDDVFLSDASPLGVPFWNLRTSASEEARRSRIADGRPGSKCPKGFLQSNEEFTDIPICTASRGYQRRKLAEVQGQRNGHVSAESQATEDLVLAKSCICHDLAGVAPSETPAEVPDVTPAICCGPNIVNFDEARTLEEMVGHIYGRNDVMTEPDRPHMFARELALYLDYLERELKRRQVDMGGAIKSLADFARNLREGIEYYRGLIAEMAVPGRDRLLAAVNALAARLDALLPEDTPQVAEAGS